MEVCELDWHVSGRELVVEFCKHCKEPSGFINGEEFFN
jgi:hypothetical protein